MDYNYYYIEKIREYEQREKEQAARQYWKWAFHRESNHKAVKKEAKGK